jgi:outer membrane receptor protein involved in Fe transport
LEFVVNSLQLKSAVGITIALLGQHSASANPLPEHPSAIDQSPKRLDEIPRSLTIAHPLQQVENPPQLILAPLQFDQVPQAQPDKRLPRSGAIVEVGQNRRLGNIIGRILSTAWEVESQAVAAQSSRDSSPKLSIERTTVLRHPTAEFESNGVAGRVGAKARSFTDTFFLEGPAKFSMGSQPNGYNSSMFNLEVGLENRSKPEFSSSKILDQPYTDANFSLGVPYKNGELTIRPTFLNFNFTREKLNIYSDPLRPVTRNSERENEERTSHGVNVSHIHKFSQGSSLAKPIKLETQFSVQNSEDTRDRNKNEFLLNPSNRFVFNRTVQESEDRQENILKFNTVLTIPVQSRLKQEIRIGAGLRQLDRERAKSIVEITNKGKQINRTGPKDTYQLEENYLAGFIQNQIFLSDRLSILPGIRIEQVQLEAADPQTTDAKTSQIDWNPSFHLFYHPTDALSFAAAISRGVNRPKWDELAPFERYITNRLTMGNPQLKPATSFNFDLGSKFQHQHITLAANFFHRQINDVIETIDIGRSRNQQTLFQPANVGDGWSQGLELEERLNLGMMPSAFWRGLTLWGKQTFLASELRENSGQTRRFQEQPNFISNLGLDYTHKPWGTTVSIAWTYISDRLAPHPNGNPTTILPFSFLSLAIRQKLSPHFGVFFEASNLTNTRIQERNQNLPPRQNEDPGQVFLLGLNWKF